MSNLEPVTESVLTQEREWTREEKFKAYGTIVGGFINNMAVGSIYMTGIISPYIHSYFGL